MSKVVLDNIQKLEIVKLYSEGVENIISLSNKYLCGRTTIWRILKNSGIYGKRVVKIAYSRKNRYTLDDNFFDEINSEEKAYFLGLLYADGCNSPKTSRIKLSLQSKDKHILEKFKSSLLYNGELLFENKRSEKWQDIYNLSIYSKQISNRLSEIGCTENKSLTLKFPQEKYLSNVLLKHFVRGYFDGDGCISINKRGFSVSLVSTYMFCNSLKEILENIKISSKIYDIKENSITKRMFINGNNNAIKFLNWIYEDSYVHLYRKYIKYKEILNKYYD